MWVIIWRKEWPSHFTSMWAFALNGVLYVAYTVWSGEWKSLVPNRDTLAEAWQVVRHDLGLRRDRCRDGNSTVRRGSPTPGSS